MSAKPRNKKLHLFFDMDGTLVDSQFAILGSLREAMKENGICVPDSLTTELIGPPIAEIVRMVCPAVDDDVLNDIAASFRRLYDSAPEQGLSPYSGIPELLDSLHEQGFSLYVVTNKPLIPTRRILEHLAWNLFTDVVTPDSGPDASVKRSKAESIAALTIARRLDVNEVIMIGDTISDIKAAHAAGVSATAVLWGYEKNKSRLLSEADFTASTAAELAAFLMKN